MKNGFRMKLILFLLGKTPLIANVGICGKGVKRGWNFYSSNDQSKSIIFDIK